MLVRIKEDIQAKIIEGELLSFPPKYVIEHILKIGNVRKIFSTKYQIEPNLFDVLDFDSKSMILSGLGLHLGTRSAVDLELHFPPKWLECKTVHGLLQLVEEHEFTLIIGSIFWADIAGKHVAVTQQIELTDDKDLFRLRIAPDMYLLFIDNNLCGWILENPSDYLVNSRNDVISPKSDSKIATLLGEYYHLTSGDNLDAMIDGTRESYESLNEFSKRLKDGTGDERRRMIILKMVQEYIANYFDDIPE